jgi:hypothetical protein
MAQVVAQVAVQVHRLLGVLAQVRLVVLVAQVFRLALLRAAQRQRLSAVEAEVLEVAVVVVRVQTAVERVPQQQTVAAQQEQRIVAVVAVVVMVQVRRVLAVRVFFIFAAVLKAMLLLQPKVMVLLQVVQDQLQLLLAVLHITFLPLQVMVL